MMMRLATFNTNFFKTGRDLCDQLLAQDLDVICLQRVRLEDIDSWHIPEHYDSWYHGDVAQDGGSSSGIMTIAAKALEHRFTSVTLQKDLCRHNAWQGNHAIICEVPGLNVINCLPCYPELQLTMDDWGRHVQACIKLGSMDNSIIMGDFHMDDHDRPWANIDMDGFMNTAAHLNTWCSGNGSRSSLDKIFTRSDVGIANVQLAISPHTPLYRETRGMHWPVLVELV
jgi:exonuclease III